MTDTVPQVGGSHRTPLPDAQRAVTEEITDLQSAYSVRLATGSILPSVMVDFPPYRSSLLRHPTKALVRVDPEAVELHSPAYGELDVAPVEADLTVQHAGSPQGERITVEGRVLDSWGRPVRRQLVEIWQANAGGRYRHQGDQHPAPLDPSFSGAGRTITDDEGRYRFTTIKPGPYPWRNHANAWRPAHIHFSVFGTSFTQRLVTQMYFPGDPLFALDPIYNAIPRQADRDRLVSRYDHDLTVPEFSMGYRFDIVVDGPDATWAESDDEI